MLNSNSLEPPSTFSLYLDVECYYADITVPQDRILSEWIEQTLFELIKLNKIKETTYSLSIRVVDETDSQHLNNQYREINSPTNVLSFPFEVPEIFKDQQQQVILGDLVICAPIVEKESLQQNKTIEEHWAHMVVHGVLHLLGYDHLNNKDAEEMEKMEVNILSALGYRNPYMDNSNE